MTKLAIVLGAVVLLLWLVFGRSRRARKDAPPPSRASTLEGMVACAHCGVHLPGSEALRLGERVYCSAAHRDAGPRE